MYRAVVVEDDQMIALLNRAYLEKDGRFRVERVFSNGRSTLDYLVRQPVDLLVLDMYMPAMTGEELLRQLRAQGVTVDVIMVTAANDTKTLESFLSLGIIDYLVKPFTYERFQQALNTFCQHHEALSGTASISQEEIDRLLQGKSEPAAAVGSPKGLQENTMEHIRSCLREQGGAGRSCEEIAEKAGLSVVTVRRYVNYMVEQGEADKQVRYDTGGRPGVLYSYRTGQ